MDIGCGHLWRHQDLAYRRDSDETTRRKTQKGRAVLEKLSCFLSDRNPSCFSSRQKALRWMRNLFYSLMGETMKYKLFATDLDCTLVTEDKRVTDRTKKAVKAFVERGGTVVLSSGRPSYGVWYVADELGLSESGGYILAYNGGELLDCKDGKVKFSVQIPPGRIAEIVGLSRRYRTAILTYENEYVISESGSDIYVQGEARNTRMKVKEIPDLVSYLTFPVVKMMMVGSEGQILRMEPVIREALGPDFSVFRSEAYHLEILPSGIDKGSGLLKTLKYLGISREETVSCGDYDNDIPMNEAAGLGVAMENGCPAIKAKADYITCSNEEDGVAAVIEKFMLQDH